ncbi:Putative oxidoreductase SadH [Gemmata sp. SH-PL17]|uniref:SDR family NAD(P)-dependent oxidoreductase n=1 Tax=Gemmata sp. SH-PL17 TaxID=1630693 RepID=UPI00078B58E3|nr:SDR family NAD(P)-dependent oxidoreductase [Gemmata sp. SH-PL17]AMV25804.1 Putative oxidoreductase SadH [Gemmata sp. SH-PL17]
MQRELMGKRAILTGASGGIGGAVAKALAKAGARVALAGRNTDKLNELAAAIRSAGGEAVAVPTDVTKADDRQRLVDHAVGAFGGLDLLVNNAGVGSWGHFADSTEAICRTVMEVNFFAPIELTRLAVPHLMRGNQSAVVNVTSMCGRKGMPAWPEYSASKFALVGMSEAWRGEFERFDIDVLTIVPGMTNSGFDRNWLRSDGKADLRFQEGMTPEYLAAKIIDAVQKNRTETVLGSEAKRLLRFNRYFPRLTNWLLARKVKKLYS